MDTGSSPLCISTDVDFARGFGFLTQRSHVSRMASLHRDAAIHSHACIIERVLLARLGGTSLHDESLNRCSIRLSAITRTMLPATRTSLQTMMRARQWWIPGTDYADLARRHYQRPFREEMAASLPTAVESSYIRPPMSRPSSAIGGSMSLHFRGSSKAARTNLLKDTPKTRKIVRQIDQHVAKQDIHGTSRYTPPPMSLGIASTAMRSPTEVGRPVRTCRTRRGVGHAQSKQIMDALRPLYPARATYAYSAICAPSSSHREIRKAPPDAAIGRGSCSPQRLINRGWKRAAVALQRRVLL